MPEKVIVVYFDGEPAYTIPAIYLNTFKTLYPQDNWTFSDPIVHLSNF